MLNRQQNSLPRTTLMWIMGLIVLSTVLFGIGIMLERQTETVSPTDNHDNTTSVEQPALATGEGAESHGEVSGQQAEGSAENSEIHNANSEGTESVGEAAHPETVLGINIENPGLIAAAIIGWIVLAVALLGVGFPTLLLIIPAALAMTVFDGLEIVTQLNRGNNGLALIALCIALLHVALLIASVTAYNQHRRANTNPIHS